MKKTAVLVLVLIMLSSCANIQETIQKDLREQKKLPLPPAPSAPGATGRTGSPSIGAAIPSWATAWAHEPTGVSLSPLSNSKFDKKNPTLIASLSGFDIVWSKGYSTNTQYITSQIKAAQPLDPSQVWTKVAVQIPTTGAAYVNRKDGHGWVKVDPQNVDDMSYLNVNGGWIQLPNKDVVTASMPSSAFEINAQQLNGLVLFGCNYIGTGSGFNEYDCNDIGGKHVKVTGEQAGSGTTLTSDSGTGSWLLKTFDLIQPLPSFAPTTPGVDNPFVPPPGSTLSSPAGSTVPTWDDVPKWAVAPLPGITLSPLISGKFDGTSPTLNIDVSGSDGYDLIWSQGYFTNTKDYLLNNPSPIVPTSAWTAFDLKKPDGTTLSTPGWISVASTDHLTAAVPSKAFATNPTRYNGVGVFACKTIGPNDGGFAEYDCKDINTKTVKVNGLAQLLSDSGKGSWMMKDFEIAPTLPPSPSAPGGTTLSLTSPTQIEVENYDSNGAFIPAGASLTTSPSTDPNGKGTFVTTSDTESLQYTVTVPTVPSGSANPIYDIYFYVTAAQTSSTISGIEIIIDGAKISPAIRSVPIPSTGSTTTWTTKNTIHNFANGITQLTPGQHMIKLTFHGSFNIDWFKVTPRCATYFQDKDGDGWGDPKAPSQTICPPPASTPTGYVTPNMAMDCNDNNAAINPAATEVCNGIDDNCDGQIDENYVCPTTVTMTGDGQVCDDATCGVRTAVSGWYPLPSCSVSSDKKQLDCTATATTLKAGQIRIQTTWLTKNTADPRTANWKLTSIGLADSAGKGDPSHVCSSTETDSCMVITSSRSAGTYTIFYSAASP